MEDSHGWRALGGSEVDPEEARQEMERLQRLPMLPYAPQVTSRTPRVAAEMRASRACADACLMGRKYLFAACADIVVYTVGFLACVTVRCLC